MILHEVRLDQVRVHHMLLLPQAQFLHEAALDGAPFGAQAGDGGQAPVFALCQGACAVSRTRSRLHLAQTCNCRSLPLVLQCITHTRSLRIGIRQGCHKALQKWSRLAVSVARYIVLSQLRNAQHQKETCATRTNGRHQQQNKQRHGDSPRARASATESAPSSSPSGLNRPDLGRLRRANPEAARFPAGGTAEGRDLAARGFVLPAIQRRSSHVIL